MVTCGICYAESAEVKGVVGAEPDMDWVGPEVVDWTAGNHATQSIQDAQSITISP